MDPPPRPVMMRSAAFSRSHQAMAAEISSAAPSPWTRTGSTRTWAMGHRAFKMRSISRTAAPTGEVIRAMVFGMGGRGFLCSGANRPSPASFSFNCSKAT